MWATLGEQWVVNCRSPKFQVEEWQHRRFIDQAACCRPRRLTNTTSWRNDDERAKNMETSRSDRGESGEHSLRDMLWGLKYDKVTLRVACFWYCARNDDEAIAAVWGMRGVRTKLYNLSPWEHLSWGNSTFYLVAEASSQLDRPELMSCGDIWNTTERQNVGVLVRLRGKVIELIFHGN